MTVDQFRRHKTFPFQWKKELESNAILRLVLEVVTDAHPDRFPVPSDLQDDISPTKAALSLGETRGYSKVLNTIKILADPVKISEAVGPTTYAEPPKQEEITHG